MEFGLFYQLNKNDEYILLYSLSKKERSVDEWIELFSSNLAFMSLGRHSLWTVDKHNIRINKIIDNHEIKNLLESNKSLKDFLLSRVNLNEKNQIKKRSE